MASSTNSVRPSRRAPIDPTPHTDAELRRQVVAELLIALANRRSGSSHGGGSIQ